MPGQDWGCTIKIGGMGRIYGRSLGEALNKLDARLVEMHQQRVVDIMARSRRRTAGGSRRRLDDTDPLLKRRAIKRR